MWFLLKAGFWFGVVLLFLPENPDALRAQRDLAQSSARSIIETVEATAQFCEVQPQICQSASEGTKLASSYITLAAEELAKRNEKPKQNPEP